MKKIVQFLLLLVTLGANAQPILTATGVNPVIGDHYYEQSVKTLKSIPSDAVSAGANKLWDFSNLVDSSPRLNTTYISPIGAPRRDSFPTANIVQYESTQNDYNYYLNNSTQQCYLGEYIPLPNYQYLHFIPQIRYLSFPMSYQKVFTDVSTYLDYANSFIPITVKDTVVADGYGTLKLPNATYSNVLRVKMYLYLYLDLGGGMFDTSGTFFYNYYANGIHEPLLTLGYQPIDQYWKVSYYRGAALPLNIHGFSANWQQTTPLLQWNAENTIATKGFSIQRSNDNRNFETIGWVDVNKSTDSKYKFLDNTAQGSILFYRLVQEDKNGERFFSNTLTLQSKETTHFSYQAFPNPAHNDIHLYIPAGQTQLVKIFNLQGKKVYENSSFQSSQSITVSDWANGTYILAVYSEVGVKVSKFEKN
jgi:hypothetical protein